MSNYPKWWNTTITIFNRYENPITHVISWYKTVLDGCFWKYVGSKVNIGNSVIETDNTICRIPENADFLEKYQWVALTSEQRSKFFTIAQGDLIIKGSVDDVIDEYTAGSRSTDVIVKYRELQGCIEVQRVAINTTGGRNNPHYYVTGV